jgi:hypothetical protein
MKMFKILKWLWLFAGVCGLLTAIKISLTSGYQDAIIYFAIAIVGGIMFFINHQRIKKLDIKN